LPALSYAGVPPFRPCSVSTPRSSNRICKQGKLDDAATAFRAAIRLKPDLAEAHFDLDTILPKSVQ